MMKPSNRFPTSIRLFLALLAFAWMPGASTLAQPIVSTSPRSQFGWEGKRITLFVTATGITPLTYQWQHHGTNLPNGTLRTLVLPQTRREDSGSYRVLVGDANGVSTSSVAQLVVRNWPQPSGPRITELERLDADMQAVLLNRGIPGGSLAVVKDGRLVFARGYGWADAENDQPFHPDTLCQIASLSKTITAAMVMSRVDEGRLSLTNRLFDLLKLEAAQYPGAVADPRLAQITVRQLLNHTAGWVSQLATNPAGTRGFDAAFWPELTRREMNLSTAATPTEFVRWMLGKRLEANPGSQLAYSSVGFLVAGRLMESMTGQSYSAAAAGLLARCGVTRTRLGRDTITDRFPGESVCYLHPSITSADVTGPENWAEPKPMDPNLPYAYPLSTLEAAGGFVGNALDHVRFIASIDGLSSFPDILTTNSVATMASGLLGWDGFLSSGGTNPETGIWGKLGFMPGAISKAVKWKNGISFVYLLNCWEKEADPDIYQRLTTSLGRGPWPATDLFEATLSYDAWRTKHFSPVEGADPAFSGEQADPDGDGQPNLLEYAQGLNPRVPNPPSNLSVRFTMTQGRPLVSIACRRLLLEHELDFRLEASADLRSWSLLDAPATESTLNPDGTILRIHALDLGASDSVTPRFFRLRVARK